MEPKPEYGVFDLKPISSKAALVIYDHASVIREVVARCAKNDERWGGPAHDDLHGLSDWISFIDHQVFEAESGDMNFRDRMINIAALAIQAVESHDRKYVEPIDAR